jgi:hypothetical protein
MHILTTLVTAATPNPLNGLVPDFTVFGAQFTAMWQKLMVGLWAVFILVAIGYLMHGILGIAQNRGGHPGQLRESKKEATNSLISLGGLIALGPIVGIAIAIFGA